MRIALVLEDLLTGGAQVHAVDLAGRLAERGFDLHVFVLGSQAAPALAARLSAPLTFLHQGGLKAPAQWAVLARHLGEARADLTLAVGPVSTCVAAAARVSGALKGALASLFHCTTVGSMAGWLRVGPYLGAARLCDALVFVSERQRRHWRGRLSAPAVRVIRNGVDLRRYPVNDALARREAKLRLGVGSQTLVFGSVAMFRPEKNHGQMLHALHRLRGEGLEAELLLVGDGPTRADTQALAGALGLGAHVRFAGERSDPRPYLAAMDAGLLCSTRVETLPLFGLELMAGGAPLIASRVGGLADLVEDGVDGLLFPAGDIDALMRRLRLCADPFRLARLGEAARRKAAGFDVETMADGYAALARELIGRRA